MAATAKTTKAAKPTKTTKTTKTTPTKAPAAKGWTYERAVTLTWEQIDERNAMSVLNALRGETLTEAQAIVKMARRELAVKRNQERVKSGEAADRFYRGDAKALSGKLGKVVGQALKIVDEQREAAKPGATKADEGGKKGAKF